MITKDNLQSTDFFHFKPYNGLNISCVYLFIFPNGAYYIGSTNSTKSRFTSHFSTAKNNKHCNRLFQSCWNKYGKPEIFVRKVKLSFRTDFEQFLIDRHFDKKECINLSPNVKLPSLQNVTVFQYSKEGNFIKKWNSIIEASNYYKICASHISEVASKKGNRKTCAGFRWEYTKTDSLENLPSIKTRYKDSIILKIDDSNNVVEVLEGLHLIVNKKQRDNIRKKMDNLKLKAYGYFWKRVLKSEYNGI